MVCLQMAAALATGEAARAVVQRLEQPPKRRRHRAPPPARADRQAVPLDLRHELRVAAQPSRRLGRDHGAVFELGAAAAGGRERRGVDVDDQTRALEAVLIRRGERGFSELEQRLHTQRALRRGRDGGGRVVRIGVTRRSGSLLAAPLDDSLPCGFQRLDQQRAVLSGKAGAQVERAVFFEVVVHELELVRLAGLRRRDSAVDAERALQLGGRERPCELEQTRLGGGGRDPRKSAHLRERELSTSERRPGRGQLLQSLGDPYVLAGLTSRDPAAPGEEPCEIVAVTLVLHRRDELDEAGSRRAQVRGERRQLVLAAQLLPPALLGPCRRDLEARCLNCQPA